MTEELAAIVKTIESKVNAGDPVAAAVAGVAQIVSGLAETVATPAPQPVSPEPTE